MLRDADESAATIAHVCAEEGLLAAMPEDSQHRDRTQVTRGRIFAAKLHGKYLGNHASSIELIIAV